MLARLVSERHSLAHTVELSVIVGGRNDEYGGGFLQSAAGWLDGRTHGRTDGRTHARTHACTHARTEAHAETRRRIDGQGWMDMWIMDE